MVDPSAIILSDEELIKLAKGIPPEGLTDEQLKERDIINWTKYFTEVVTNQGEAVTRRSKIRKMIFGILKARVRHTELKLSQQVLYDIIEKQLDPNRALTWDKFTFTWDLAPFTHGLKVVQKEHWSREGGGFDEVGYYPPAFTKQVID